MNIIGIIPARMGSSRFPGKPLAKICGIPMIGHVFFRSRMCALLSQVCVATCDREIADYVNSIGGKTIMTAPTHTRASDRAAEALLNLERETAKSVDIVVMIQGDEPMLYPEMIEEATRPLMTDKNIQIVNLIARIKSREEREDPNTVKVVVDLNNWALYFSREPIPSGKMKKGGTDNGYKQVCVIPFRRDFLIKFNELTPTPLEIIESVDMLRVLEHGYKVKIIPSVYDTYSVDTREDLHKVEKLMHSDYLFGRYATHP